MKTDVYLISPPFTQLNTPYPATAYLKGFLNTKGISSAQSDLGIDVILNLFSAAGLKKVFDTIHLKDHLTNVNSERMVALSKDYITTIDLVIAFLQHKNPTLAHAICENDFLPKASRFNHLDDLEWAFGTMGQQDKARHLATLYLEDLADLIKDELDPHFGFSRYAEHLGRSASTFDELDAALQKNYTFTDQILVDILSQKMAEINPKMVAISIAFPGNLYSGFRCANYIKKHYPATKIALGGGYVNTELRSLADPRVFNYVDFVTLDDGEAPIVHLIEYLNGTRKSAFLKRTFILENDAVVYRDGSVEKDYTQAETGTTDYTGLSLNNYLSVIELANPMHSLWSNGRWNKLTLAHGCYWGKCTFCDTSLDYIKRYEQTSAPLLCDRMETLIAQTGETGFHFVDEAAPPALLRDLALEILRRDIKVVWWTNIRFEKSFTPDLCRLLKASGCIAMSGGLEVASDRLLKLIDKGVTVAQVATVCSNFTEAGILVHAYLMYGYPTQTAQETIDSLEMVRQLFQQGIIQSGFWHRFAMTAHSPVGMNPKLYGSKLRVDEPGTFANNDLEYEEENGIDHELFSKGLRVSLYNYMRGAGFDMRLQDWFEESVPKTTVSKKFIESVLNQPDELIMRPSARIFLVGSLPSFNSLTEIKFIHRHNDQILRVSESLGKWLQLIFPKLIITQQPVLTFKEFKQDFESNFNHSFEQFWLGKTGEQLRLNGVLVV